MKRRPTGAQQLFCFSPGPSGEHGPSPHRPNLPDIGRAHCNPSEQRKLSAVWNDKRRRRIAVKRPPRRGRDPQLVYLAVG